MHTEDKILQDKLEEAKEKNLNLRFDNVEKQLTEIKDILKESNTLSKTEIEALKHADLKLSERIAILEEHRRACPIIAVKNDTMRYSRETSFLRGLFKNPWKGVVVTIIVIIIINILVIAFGPNFLFESLLKLKGL